MREGVGTPKIEYMDSENFFIWAGVTPAPGNSGKRRVDPGAGSTGGVSELGLETWGIREEAKEHRD